MIQSAKLTTLALLLLVVGTTAGCSRPAPEAPPAAEAPVVSTEAPEMPAEAITPVVAPAPAPEVPLETPPAPKLEAPSDEWLIVPGVRVGKITATSTEAELIAAYGAENIQETEFYLGEGESEMGTGLFLDDETKAIRILWENPEKKERPVSVELTGSKSLWATAEGISLGTPLTKVQEINGKPFKIYGFEWDYGGYLSDGNDGNIKGLPHEDPVKGFQPVSFGMTFQHDFDAKPDYPQEKYAEVSGDTEFSSDLPTLQEMNPVVYSMTISFPEAEN